MSLLVNKFTVTVIFWLFLETGLSLDLTFKTVCFSVISCKVSVFLTWYPKVDMKWFNYLVWEYMLVYRPSASLFPSCNNSSCKSILVLFCSMSIEIQIQNNQLLVFFKYKLFNQIQSRAKLSAFNKPSTFESFLSVFNFGKTFLMIFTFPL